MCYNHRVPFSEREHLTPLEIQYMVTWWRIDGSFNYPLYVKLLKIKEQLTPKK